MIRVNDFLKPPIFMLVFCYLLRYVNILQISYRYSLRTLVKLQRRGAIRQALGMPPEPVSLLLEHMNIEAVEICYSPSVW